jgi:multiple sugar transport system permease protein
VGSDKQLGQMKDNTLKYLLVMPAVLVVFVTAIWPLIESLRLSFTVGRLNRPGITGSISWLGELQLGDPV